MRTAASILGALVLLAALGAARPAAAQSDVDPIPRPGGGAFDPRVGTFPGGYRLPPLEPSRRVDVGGDEPLALGQVLASVERHHPTLESARQRVRAAEGEQLAAEGGFDLGLEARGWASPEGYYDWGRADVSLEQATPLWGTSVYAGWRVGRGGDIPDYYGRYRTLDLGELRAGVRVPLWRDGPIDSRRARIWGAAHATDAEEASLEARRLTMRLDATRAYWTWVAAGLRYEVLAELLALAERRDGQIAARVSAGAIPPIESLENRRVIVSRRTSLVSARRALEQAAIALSLHVRRDDGRPHVVDAGRVPTELTRLETLTVSLRQEVEAAWGRRPELERYRALVERQRVAVDLAENQFSPRIDLSVGASIDIGSGSTTERQRLGPAVLEGSVRVSFPLQFREARGGIARTRAELGALRADAQLARERIATQVQDAFSAVRAAEERLELARQSAEIAWAVADAERRRFELGATQLFIVNLREQAAGEARAVLVDAEALLHMAHAQWHAAIAAPLAE